MLLLQSIRQLLRAHQENLLLIAQEDDTDVEMFQSLPTQQEISFLRKLHIIWSNPSMNIVYRAIIQN